MMTIVPSNDSLKMFVGVQNIRGGGPSGSQRSSVSADHDEDGCSSHACILLRSRLETILSPGAPCAPWKPWFKDFDNITSSDDRRQDDGDEGCILRIRFGARLDVS